VPTPFSITLNSGFQSGTAYQVNFIQAGGLTVSTQVASSGGTTLTGTAPVNHTYLGAIKTVQVVEVNQSGPPVLQLHKTGLYYALPMPTAISSVSGSVPAIGGSLTVTGSGFKTWPLFNSSGFQTTVNPTVVIGTAKKANPVNQVPFTVSPTGVTTTAIPGLVGPTPSNVQTCSCSGSGGPCKLLSVINPGGSFSTGDNLTSSQPIVTITGPPPPTAAGITSNQGAQSNTLGIVLPVPIVHGVSMAQSVEATITGAGFNTVTPVTINGSSVVFIVKSHGTQISFGVPPIRASSVTTVATVTIGNSCNSVNVPGGWTYTAAAPIQWFTKPLLTSSGNGITQFVVGPSETMAIGKGIQTCSPTCDSLSLTLPSFVVGPVLGITSANLGTIQVKDSCGACDVSTGSGTISIVAVNTLTRGSTSVCGGAFGCQISQGCGVGR
jgi:hypothetical protein